ncbi:unnamed protein product, partial [Symbiodinium necroappetens]
MKAELLLETGPHPPGGTPIRVVRALQQVGSRGGCPLSHENKLVMQRCQNGTVVPRRSGRLERYPRSRKRRGRGTRMGFLRQIGFWKKTSSAVVPFDQEAQCDRRNEVKLLTPDAQSKLGSTSNSTACSDDVMHRPELRTPTPGSSPSESTCSYTTGSANVSMDPPSSPLAESEDDRRTSLRSTAVAPPHSPRVVEEVLQDSTKEATPDFKLSPSEIYAAVAAEFGEETASLLQSTKWDKRQRGLQSISAVLNGSDLEGVAVALPGSARSTKGLFRERASAWEVSCLVLNHVLRDKVIPVGLTALELFRDTFQNIDVSISAAQVQHAVSVLIEHVMFRI